MDSQTIGRVWLVLFGASSLCIALAAPPTSLAEERQTVDFNWSFGAWINGEPNGPFVPILQGTTLNSGDQLKMLVQPLTDCFIYFVHHGPGAEIELLFPPSLDSPLEKNTLYYAPPGDLRLILDHNVGEEAFHLLASNERLIGLETLLKDHASAAIGAKPSLSSQIVDEIRKLRQSALATDPEKPVDIGGSVRSARNSKLVEAAVKFSSRRFFAKSFTIDHR